MESFDCICGQHFDTMADMQEHWETNTSATTGRPHYRLITSGAYNEPEGKSARQMPPMRKDEENKTRWSTSSQVIEDAIAAAKPAADWLRRHPPGARLPDELEPGYEPDEYMPESKGVDE